MSNTISIQYTNFVNLDEKGNEESFSYGFRLYDNYEKVYSNTYDNFTALKEDLNEENFWEVINRFDEFEDAEDCSNGIEFNGNFYDWDEINEMRKEIDQRTMERCDLD
jgi:hypothetical protein